jgi:FlaG/FlaF family flagellin (archaellin)
MKRVTETDAVSPVVGVMLMLVVTIIIAAVVSGFAGGLAGDNKVAPSASIEVKIDTAAGDTMGGISNKMTFEMLSGDSIPTKDLEIITYFTNSTGYVFKTSHTASSDLFSLYGGSGLTRLPFLNDMAVTGGSTKDAAHFGNFTWSTGDIMACGNGRQVAEFLGLDWTAGVWPADDTIDEADFKPGAVVDVKILHVPSGKYIYDKEVVVL